MGDELCHPPERDGPRRPAASRGVDTTVWGGGEAPAELVRALAGADSGTRVTAVGDLQRRHGNASIHRLAGSLGAAEMKRAPVPVQREGEGGGPAADDEVARAIAAAQAQVDEPAYTPRGEDPPAPADESGPGPLTSFPEQGTGITSRSAGRETIVQDLASAATADLAAQGIPPPTLVGLSSSSRNQGEAYFSERDWAMGVNLSNLSGANVETRAEIANTVGHESFHMYEAYEMARLQAGRGENPYGAAPLAKVPPAIVPGDVHAKAAENPILQSDEHTHEVEQWYESMYGKGKGERERILSNVDEDRKISVDRRADYCRLPEERAAWAVGRAATERMRQMEGAATPPAALDASICVDQDTELVSKQ